MTGDPDFLQSLVPFRADSGHKSGIRQTPDSFSFRCDDDELFEHICECVLELFDRTGVMDIHDAEVVNALMPIALARLKSQGPCGKEGER